MLRNCYLLELGVFGPDYGFRRREGSLNRFISKDLVGSMDLVVAFVHEDLGAKSNL